MKKVAAVKKGTRTAVRRWVRRGFLLWAVFSTLWLANSYRTRGVPEATLQSNAAVSVTDGATLLELSPMVRNGKTGLIFICGSGVSAHAYAPLLRPIAEAGYPVFIVKLPYRFAPLEFHKQAAVDRAREVVATHPEILSWVLSGHSLGGALACRLAQSDAEDFSAMVLIGTTHPKRADLSSLPLSVIKVYASNDGIAPSTRVLANRKLLPNATQWVEIKGGNHSQFGHYGHQLMDGRATISRETQQAAARSSLLDALGPIAKKT